MENYFTATERAQLNQIQHSTQTNLFSESLESQEIPTAQPIAEGSTEAIELNLEDILVEIDKEMKRLGWSELDGKKYICDRYNSKSRRLLSDEQLLEFWEYLKQSI